MSTRRIITLAALLFCMTPVYGLTIEQYSEINKHPNSEDELQLEIYLGGVYDGLKWFNAVHRDFHSGTFRSFFFCLPENLHLNAKNLRNILDHYIANEMTSTTDWSWTKFTLEHVLLQELIITFPCDKR
tara:strand:- start:295 stop:681 length:387 start_codon:yes stop_codon:yes gene_type:complete